MMSAGTSLYNEILKSFLPAAPAVVDDADEADVEDGGASGSGSGSESDGEEGSATGSRSRSSLPRSGRGSRNQMAGDESGLQEPLLSNGSGEIR